MKEKKIEDLSTAFLIGFYTDHKEKDLAKAHVDELESLAKTYGFEAVAKHAVHLRQISSGTYMGKGKLEELAKERKELGADVVIIDDEISPNQQKNIEKAFGIPVIDRAELILEVFSKHAQTREARLQIELAKHKYQLPRLRRMWTHLSRQSGSGQLKGEGEQQIEIDRRILRTRISQLETELKNVRSHRMTQRRARLRSGDPLFAIIGYTNAGKSTLLNFLTDAGVLVEDKLFATLDTTTRKVELPSRQTAMLIDTVGFVRKLPHTLVASFQSTLEEAAFTDALIHVVDISDPMAQEHADTTLEVLKELGIKNKPIITVLNKVDACDNNNAILKFKLSLSKTVPISAKTGEGIDLLLERMEKEIEAIRKVCELRIPQKEYALVSQLMREGRVLTEEYEDNDILLKVEVPSHLLETVERYTV